MNTLISQVIGAVVGMCVVLSAANEGDINQDGVTNKEDVKALLDLIECDPIGPEPTTQPAEEPDPVVVDPVEEPTPSDLPSWYIPASYEWPNEVLVFTGTRGSKGFNIWNDQALSWWFHDITMNGNGADATLFAVGSDCRIERANIYGGKHGVRMASVTRLRLADSTIKSDPSNLGKSLKICGSYGRGPASSYVTVENCKITGIVAIQPLNRTPQAACENVHHVVIRKCVIKPHGNTAIEIAAKHILIDGCTFDFTDTKTSFARGVMAHPVFNTQSCFDVTVRNCVMKIRRDQSSEMISDLRKVVKHYGNRIELVN